MKSADYFVISTLSFCMVKGRSAAPQKRIIKTKFYCSFNQFQEPVDLDASFPKQEIDIGKTRVQQLEAMLEAYLFKSNQLIILVNFG